MRKNQEYKKQLDVFEQAFGGINIYILKKPRGNEYKYNIIPTEGKPYYTNDFSEFFSHLWSLSKSLS